MSRCWSRNLTRHRLSTPSCIATLTFWPAADAGALIKRGHDAKREMQAGAR